MAAVAQSGGGEPLYAAEQIHIPSSLPDILKQFTKAAIKTRPENLTQWAADYFGALADGRQPPVASRVTITGTPTAAAAAAAATAAEPSAGASTPGELSFQHLAALKLELGEGGDTVDKAALVDACSRLSFPAQAVKDALGVGGFGESVPWRTFVALEAATLQPGMQDTLGIVARLFSTEGTAAGGIPFEVFKEVYTFLGGLDSDVSGSIESTLNGLAGRDVVHIGDLEGAMAVEASQEQAEAEAVGEQMGQAPLGRSLSSAPEGDPPAGLEVVGAHAEAVPIVEEAEAAAVAAAMQQEEEVIAEDAPAEGSETAVDLVVEGAHVEPEDVVGAEAGGATAEPLAEAEAAAEAEAPEEAPLDDTKGGEEVVGLEVVGAHVDAAAVEAGEPPANEAEKEAAPATEAEKEAVPANEAEEGAAPANEAEEEAAPANEAEEEAAPANETEEEAAPANEAEEEAAAEEKAPVAADAADGEETPPAATEKEAPADATVEE